MYKFKKIFFFTLICCINQNAFSMNLLSDEDIKQIKDLLSSVSSSISTSIVNSLTKQRKRNFLITQIEKGLQKQNLSSDQVKTIMDSIKTNITEDYYNQILLSYKNALSSVQIEDASSVISQIQGVVEKSLELFVGYEIDNISKLEGLKLTDKQKQEIIDYLMKDQRLDSKDKILDQLKKDKQFNNSFSSGMQEQIHLHFHSHLESDGAQLSGLKDIKNVNPQLISRELGQFQTRPLDVFSSVPAHVAPAEGGVLLHMEYRPAVRSPMEIK